MTHYYLFQTWCDKNGVTWCDKIHSNRDENMQIDKVQQNHAANLSASLSSHLSIPLSI